MSAAHEEYDDLHHLIDRLTLPQVRAIRAVVVELAESRPSSPPADNTRRRTLSFAGIVTDEPDIAERSEEIIRDRFRPR